MWDMRPTCKGPRFSHAKVKRIFHSKEVRAERWEWESVRRKGEENKKKKLKIEKEKRKMRENREMMMLGF